MDDVTFRIVLLAASVVQLTLGAYYAKKSGAGTTVFRRKGEGPILTALLALTYLASALGVIAYLIEPKWMAWGAFEAGAALRWFGAGLLGLGLVLIEWALHYLGTNLTFVPVTKEEHALITTGPYGWVRHPIYSAFLLESAGISLMMANWFVALTSGACWLLLAYRTRIEEGHLIRKFGDDYRTYIEEVGPYLPRLRT